jgi:capsular polysaccharide export protein
MPAAHPAEPCSPILVVGIKPWKRWQITPFLTPGATGLKESVDDALRYVDARDALKLAKAGRVREVVVWAAREPAGFAEALAAHRVPLLRMEDGFLRSVGLGCNHIGGHSLVVDAQGIHFDPRQPSTLETLLQHAPADASLLARAAALRQSLVRLGLSKYNVGNQTPAVLGGQPGQRRVLVVGQVENDASLRLGAPGIHNNRALLAAARAAYPDDWLIYKPHPDTEAGARPGRIAPHEALQYANQVVTETSITRLFPEVQQLCTMTSLAGFEALLRDVPVHTWGLPFYAGWGLTRDELALPRRTRRLCLDALVAATLIQYPRYRHPVHGGPCEVEDVVAALAQRPPATPQSQRAAWRRWARQGAGLWRSWRGARADGA